MLGLGLIWVDDSVIVGVESGYCIGFGLMLSWNRKVIRLVTCELRVGLGLV